MTAATRGMTTTAATRGVTMARAQSLSTIADGAVLAAIQVLDAPTGWRSTGSPAAGLDGFRLNGVAR